MNETVEVGSLIRLDDGKAYVVCSISGSQVSLLPAEVEMMQMKKIIAGENVTVSVNDSEVTIKAKDEKVTVNLELNRLRDRVNKFSLK